MSQSTTILIVDDIAANRQTLHELLDLPSLNYHIVEAENGPEALRVAAEARPDLVLLDVMMPSMDGFEVCRRLRADPLLAEMPVIMVTALDDLGSRLAGLDVGADDFITKPYHRAELRARVRTIAQLSRYRRLHEAQAALRESENHFQALFALGPVAVYSCDTTGTIQDFNDRAVRLWGGKPRPGELGDRFCGAVKMYHPDGTWVPPEKSAMAEVCGGRIPAVEDQEFLIERPDGSRISVLLNIAPVRNDQGQVTCAISCFHDITARKRLDEHFLQVQKMEALGRFSGGIAHDFNNILTAIGGYAELSQMILKGNIEVRAHLSSVLKATGRASELVRQILAFSRQEPQARQPILLQPLIAESLLLMRATIPSTIEFDTEIAADAPTVLANASQIHQVLMNLGMNAWQAMKDRPGRIQVTLELFAVSAEYAATKPRLRAGNYVRVSVSDTGSGIDPGTLRHIFEPFFTTRAPGGGTGLGLSVVHGIMDGHDGAVTVHSQLGEGTVFRLYFPVHDGAAVPAPPDEGRPPRGTGETVLVVDDEEVLALLIQKALTELGYRVEFTTEPAAALAIVRAKPERFQLVLSDQTMPGMTGLDLARQLHQLRPALPIILMTGYSLPLTAERIEETGIRQLMLKPITIQALGRAVHATIAGQPAG
jgi:PAS domain S-box-containing protein